MTNLRKSPPDQTPVPKAPFGAGSSSPSEDPPSNTENNDSNQDKSSSAEDATRPHCRPTFPSPKLRLKCPDLKHEGALQFFHNTNPSNCVEAAVASVLTSLYHASKSSTDIPPTRSVTLILRAMGGVAYTTGTELDDDHKEIHFSLDYIKGVSLRSPTRIGSEIQGVLVHEMVHAWQWNGMGNAPGGLIEGIADFVRLGAGLSPPHWKKEIPDSWDAGYQHTAYFLEWLEDTFGKDSVAKINLALKDEKYDEETFWIRLFGTSVSDLFNKYKSSLANE